MASKGNNVLAMYIICCREGKYLEKRKIANIFKMGYLFSYRDGKAERFRKVNQMKGKIEGRRKKQVNKKHDSDNNFATYVNVIVGILLRKERRERKKYL